MLRRMAIPILVLGLAGCAGDHAPPPETPEREPAATDASPEMEPGVQGDPLDGDPDVVARDLEVPWDIAFADDDLILLTERGGSVRAIRDGRVQEEPVGRVDAAEIGEGGLLGIAVHPEWPEDARVYLYYTHPGGSNRVSMFEVADAQDPRLGEEEVILEGIPAASNHDGGRIDFGPDGALYVTTGDAGEPGRSADLDSLGGKILRVDEEGRVPRDNPFDGSPVWAYGLRNPQGIAWDEEGRLYASDHGPSGDLGLCCLDELNLVTEGSFHGWPFRSGDRSTGVGEPPEEPEDPIAHSGDDTWAPSGIAYLDGGGERSILMANLRGGHLRRFTISEDRARRVEEQEVALEGFGRLRHVAVGPDGCVYVLTSNRDGRGDPAPSDDRVLRFCG